jgi:hypothetical protein
MCTVMPLTWISWDAICPPEFFPRAYLGSYATK